jgi:hypothetical protein
MFSILKPCLVYKDISPEIMDHDTDFEADEWSYDSRDVYRGTFDPNYMNEGLNVYWLYDKNLRRVGLAEHEIKNPEIFKTLWFHDNPFATLFQNSEWKSKSTTLWSLLSNEAYQDCLESDFKYVFDDALRSGKCLLTPEKIMEKEISYYECSVCSKKSFSELEGCQAVKKVMDFTNFSILFLDDSYVLYDAPLHFKWPVQHDAFSEEPLEEQVQLADLLESVNEELENSHQQQQESLLHPESPLHHLHPEPRT